MGVTQGVNIITGIMKTLLLQLFIISRISSILNVYYFGKLLLRIENTTYFPGLNGWAIGIKEWYTQVFLMTKFRN